MYYIDYMRYTAPGKAAASMDSRPLAARVRARAKVRAEAEAKQPSAVWYGAVWCSMPWHGAV